MSFCIMTTGHTPCLPLLILFLFQGLLVKGPVPGLDFQHHLPSSGLQDGTSVKEGQIAQQSSTIC